MVYKSIDLGLNWAALPTFSPYPASYSFGGPIETSTNGMVIMLSFMDALIVNGINQKISNIRVSTDGGNTWRSPTTPPQQCSYVNTMSGVTGCYGTWGRIALSAGKEVNQPNGCQSSKQSTC